MSPSDGSKVQPDPASGAFEDIGPNYKRLKARLAKTITIIIIIIPSM